MELQYDYIILGAGASGLLLAYRMSQDLFFDDKSILIIDQTKDKGNDRTWCFWEEGIGEWDDLLVKTWSNIYFGSDAFSKTISISPFHYKMIRSEVFYGSLWKSINSKSNFSFIEEEVDSFSELKTGVEVVTKSENYLGSKLFNSIPDPEVYKLQNRYPLMHQHFVGWFVKTKADSFDDSEATFMDFSVPQKGNTRFMYVLPIDKKTALFEYTLFSKELLELSDYEDSIKNYLKNKNILDYEIVEKEKGVIPMTSFKFNDLNSEHILNIGTAGGWTKASTGYTFMNTSKKTKDLVSFLKKDGDLSKFDRATKYRFYDLIFLDVLANHNHEGAALFSSMFKKADVKTIFKFLDEDSTFLEDLRIILSVPPKRFIQAFLKRLF
ncbi:lycopene cyclase family protein [Winogradskyella thalassocola]|uniref:Lycopene beta-cyclase n=1 Tax=Winogradskyella thalassocola TaxID=262004 RepID=A0A1G8BRH2_9FLAO|nr:lycopene cyclase family protein [Winogradskyella thalassocola]SDH35815.1 lycopene beta-cyclase [Winogradskyella thalassocola]